MYLEKTVRFQVIHVIILPQETADSAESLDELETFRGFVGDELERSTEVDVVFSDPFRQLNAFNNFQFSSGVGVSVVLGVGQLFSAQIDDGSAFIK